MVETNKQEPRTSISGVPGGWLLTGMVVLTVFGFAVPVCVVTGVAKYFSVYLPSQPDYNTTSPMEVFPWRMTSDFFRTLFDFPLGAAVNAEMNVLMATFLVWTHYESRRLRVRMHGAHMVLTYLVGGAVFIPAFVLRRAFAIRSGVAPVDTTALPSGPMINVFGVINLIGWISCGLWFTHHGCQNVIVGIGWATYVVIPLLVIVSCAYRDRSFEDNPKLVSTSQIAALEDDEVETEERAMIRPSTKTLLWTTAFASFVAIPLLKAIAVERQTKHIFDEFSNSSLSVWRVGMLINYVVILAAFVLLVLTEQRLTLKWKIAFVILSLVSSPTALALFVLRLTAPLMMSDEQWFELGHNSG